MLRDYSIYKKKWSKTTPCYNKQKDDLERQIDNVKTYMYAKGYQINLDLKVREEAKNLSIMTLKS